MTFPEIQCKVGRGAGRGGQICLPKPSATASLSGRKQKQLFLVLINPKQNDENPLHRFLIENVYIFFCFELTQIPLSFLA
jgi:hypothetical protein